MPATKRDVLNAKLKFLYKRNTVHAHDAKDGDMEIVVTILV
jgi:hypothetical protein